MKNQPINDTSQAFEYVLGTLDSEERAAFEQQMRRDHRIADEVQYWEAHLASTTDNVTEMVPAPETFQAIQNRIQKPRFQASETTRKSSFFDLLFSWRTATASLFAVAFLVGLLFIQPPSNPTGTGAPVMADYVAVLLDNADAPVLTALTTAEGKSLFLKWESEQPIQNYSLQLWSKSRRDGEIRPLVVFNSYDKNTLQLDEATLRLIKDSSHLILTREEVGGSPFDEPSEFVIAQGVCIRFSQPKPATT